MKPNLSIRSGETPTFDPAAGAAEEARDAAPKGRPEVWPAVTKRKLNGQPHDMFIRPADIVVTQSDHPVEYSRLVSRTQDCPALELLRPHPDAGPASSVGDSLSGSSVILPEVGRLNFDAEIFLEGITPSPAHFTRSRLAVTDGSSLTPAWASLSGSENVGAAKHVTIHVATGDARVPKVIVRARQNVYDVGLRLANDSGELTLVSPDAVAVHLFGKVPGWAQEARSQESPGEKRLRRLTESGRMTTLFNQYAWSLAGIAVISCGVGLSLATYGSQKG